MMGSMNKVFVLGNLGDDVRLAYTKSGGAVCNFRMATNENWKNAEGEPKSRTEWIRVVCFGKLAETCGEYLSKGRQVLVEGKLQTRSYPHKTHEDVTMYTTEVVAQRVQFLGGPRNGSEKPEAEENKPSAE